MLSIEGAQFVEPLPRLNGDIERAVALCNLGEGTPLPHRVDRLPCGLCCLRVGAEQAKLFGPRQLAAAPENLPAEPYRVEWALLGEQDPSLQDVDPALEIEAQHSLGCAGLVEPRAGLV